MRYEHDVYKEFKERAPFRNTTVNLEGKEGQVVDYSMVEDSVLVQFGQKRSDRQLVPLGRLARENPGIEPADPEDWLSKETSRTAKGSEEPPAPPAP